MSITASAGSTVRPAPAAVGAVVVLAAPNTAAADRATDRADRARRIAATATVPVLEHAAAPHRATPLRYGASRRGATHRTNQVRRAGQGRPATWVAPTDGGRASTVIAWALAQVGKPYVWAAAGPGGYDCSGLVLAAYAQVGIRLPHQTGGIIGYGRHVARGQLQPGDVVFPQRGHVAVYLGNNMIVHAPHRGDHVRVAPLYGFYSAVRLL